MVAQTKWTIMFNSPHSGITLPKVLTRFNIVMSNCKFVLKLYWLICA